MYHEEPTFCELIEQYETPNDRMAFVVDSIGEFGDVINTGVDECDKVAKEVFERIREELLADVKATIYEIISIGKKITNDKERI